MAFCRVASNATTSRRLLIAVFPIVVIGALLFLSRVRWGQATPAPVSAVSPRPDELATKGRSLTRGWASRIQRPQVDPNRRVAPRTSLIPLMHRGVVHGHHASVQQTFIYLYEQMSPSRRQYILSLLSAGRASGRDLRDILDATTSPAASTRPDLSGAFEWGANSSFANIVAICDDYSVMVPATNGCSISIPLPRSVICRIYSNTKWYRAVHCTESGVSKTILIGDQRAFDIKLQGKNDHVVLSTKDYKQWFGQPLGTEGVIDLVPDIYSPRIEQCEQTPKRRHTSIIYRVSETVAVTLATLDHCAAITLFGGAFCVTADSGSSLGCQ